MKLPISWWAFSMMLLFALCAIQYDIWNPLVAIGAGVAIGVADVLLKNAKRP